MFYRNQYFRLALLIILLILLSGVMALLVRPWSWYALLPAIGIIPVVYAIIKLFNRVPRKISYFLNAIENEDSTLYFPESIAHSPTKEMHISLNRINKLIQEVKLRNRQQEQYYGMLLEQVATGITVVNNKGSVLLANRAAKELLNYPYLTHIDQLKRVDINLYNAFENLQDSSNHRYVKVSHKEKTIHLSLNATTFLNNESALRVISIHDISSELDAKEIESWQKLIRVLTHEIMNSITPITSLSETILKYYVPGTGSLPDEKTVANTVKGLEVINERGVGLINFVESYRKLTKLSQPVLKPVLLSDIIEHLLLLLGNEECFHRIRFSHNIEPKDLYIEADESQISQVFINLINNAMHAVESTDNPEIRISASVLSSGQCEIKITDNGVGIPAEIIDQIFIPFFTTKENGSGIGLSLTRQIISNHGGTIEVSSSPGNTRFIIRL